MKSGHDINKLPGDGYLIVPLSMSRLADGSGQDPEWCYDVITFFSKKLASFSSDVVFLYTYGLYTNTNEPGFEARKKINQQALNHVTKLRKMIEVKKEFMPRAFHYLPLDYVILNSPKFGEFMNILKALSNNDPAFRECITKDIMGREFNEPNTNFILEEIAVAHIVRQHMVDFPHTLVKSDAWRLLVYPGGPINSDEYQIQNNILPQKNNAGPYSTGQYDYNNKIYNDYKDLKFN
ncbi:MAG: hypothetical protein ACI9BF_000538 [Candidatus Paceibacteria bacterium]|jgi:hypothetical protein